MEHASVHSSSRGRWVVVALVALGLCAAALAVAYWKGVARRTWPEGPPSTASADPIREGAGAAPWDPKQAEAELSELAERINRSAGSDRDRGAMVEAARRLVERYPRFAEARSLLGKLLLDAHRTEDAYKEFQTSLGLDPQQPDVELLSGTIAKGRGDAEAALRHYGRAAEIQPENPLYKLYVAQMYFDRGDYERVRSMMLELVRRDSAYYPAYGMLADVYTKQRKFGLAVQQADKAVENTPISKYKERAVYVRKKAEILKSDNKPDQALEVLRSLPENEREKREVVAVMAECWAMLRQPANAAAEYERAIEASPGDAELLEGAITWRLKAGDKDAARKHLATLRGINPRLNSVQRFDEELR
jgi:tetratricopeptide (TPR) repeat protein